MAKSLFDHLNAIYQDQSSDYYDELDDVDRKTYSQYMLNRFMSMNMNYIPVVDELQKYYGVIDNREHYRFFTGILPKGRQFNKYIKSDKKKKYDSELLKLLADHFMASQKDVEVYIDLYISSPRGKEELTEILSGYGWDTKKIKKAGVK